LDHKQVLKRLPSANPSKDPGGEGTSSALNDSIRSLLQTHCGLGQNSRESSQRKGKRVPAEPGSKILALSNSPPNSTSTDEERICSECNKAWEKDGDDRWIVCDSCNKQWVIPQSDELFFQK